MILILGYLIKNDVSNIRVAILDPSRDHITSVITERIAANDYFILTDDVATEAEARERFNEGKVDLVVMFCPEFANRTLHSHDATIMLLTDGSEPNKASVQVGYAQQVIMGIQKDVMAKVASTGNAAQTGISPMNITVNARMLYNPQQRSEVNFVPAVVAIIMMLICCMMTSIAIVRERETGTMEILLASPLPIIHIVLAKLMPYLAISLFNLSTILLMTTYMMDVPVAGSLTLYLFTAVIYIIVSLLLGLFISCCVNTQLAAMLISLLMIVPSLYLSDMIFSVDSMPAAVQAASNIVPAKWFVSASRKIMIQGVEAQYVIKEIAMLLLQGAVLLLLSWRLFKRRLE